MQRPPPVAEPTSDDELQLMCEAESLQTQLKRAGEPVDEQIAQLFIDSLASKSLPERMRKWQLRRDHLQHLLGLRLPRPASGGPAVLSAVAGTRHDLENPEKAAIGVDDWHSPPPGAGVNRRRRGSAQMDSPPPAAKRAKGRPMFPYTEREDGKPQEMTLPHVQFAQMSVALLRKNPVVTPPPATLALSAATPGEAAAVRQATAPGARGRP